jgi:hypothetical protein
MTTINEGDRYFKKDSGVVFTMLHSSTPFGHAKHTRRFIRRSTDNLEYSVTESALIAVIEKGLFIRITDEKQLLALQLKYSR